MQRSKLILILVALIIVVGGGILLYSRLSSGSDAAPAASPVPVAPVIYRGEDNKTVLDLLKVNAVIEVTTASTPVVISINGVSNTSTKYWTFFINGKKQAAERANIYLTRPADDVEWRYISTAE